jgi:hypothetical protein
MVLDYLYFSFRLNEPSPGRKLSGSCVDVQMATQVTNMLLCSAVPALRFEPERTTRPCASLPIVAMTARRLKMISDVFTIAMASPA